MKNSILNESIQNGSVYAIAGASVGAICMLSSNKSVRLLGVGLATAGVGTWITMSVLNQNNVCKKLNATNSTQNITFANDDVKKFVEKYAIQQCNRNGKIKNKKYFNRRFADIYTEILNAPEHFYITNETNYLRNSESDGEFYYDSNRFVIVFKNNPDKKYGNRAGAMFEEFYHAKQFLDGKVWFVKHNNSWIVSGGNALIEYEAKNFATNAKNYGDNYRHTFDNNAPSIYVLAKTQLGLISEMNQNQGIFFLTRGYSYKVYDTQSQERTINYDAPYPEFLNIPTNITNRLNKQTTNSIYAYPYP